MNLYLLGVGMISWVPLILTAVVPVGVLLCEVAVFCYDEFGSGGYLCRVTAAQLLLLNCGKFSDCLQ